MDTTTRTIATDLETIAMKLAYDQHRLHTTDDDRATVETTYRKHRNAGNDPAEAVTAAARELGAYAVCDWCQHGPTVLAIDSTAGARCRDCHDNVALCGWCGEEPADGDDERCTDCRDA